MINIDELIKQSLRSGNKTELKAYRNLKAEFQKVKTAKDYKGEWTESIEIYTIAKYARSLDTAITEFGGPQTTLGAEYTSELEVVKKLLPEPVNELQICSELSEWCRENNFTQRFQTAIGYEEHSIIPKKKMGDVIKHLKSKFPQADGKMISEIVKKYLI